MGHVRILRRIKVTLLWGAASLAISLISATPGPASAAATDDADSDSFGGTRAGLPLFSDDREAFLGTNPTGRCAATSAVDDEPSPDAWPLDFNDDQFASLPDVLAFIPVVNTSAPGPPYSARFDLNGSGGVGLNDVLLYIRWFNTACSDPANLAPPLDSTVATDFSAATQFLYTGADPVQTGVAPGAIEPLRVAVLRGRVLTRTGTPISGVMVSVLNQPQLGQTLTARDGRFDMAVNGGGLLTLKYEKAGYLPVQRQQQTPWRDYVIFDDVVMIPLDSAVTTVNLSVADMQVARGNAVSDADGTRQATVLVPQGTSAEMVLPGGGRQPLATMNVRATEYTVGATGPAAMPGDLPQNSAYTYAVELSVDEAVATGATDIVFSQPLPFYLENFLGFPVGMDAPAGYYDREKGQWIPSASGRVVKVVSFTNSRADLDITGDDVADDATPLGVTTDERTRLAQLYAVGQTLWRVPVTHFTPWDINWGWGPPPNAVPPSPRDPDPPLEDPCIQSGSVIGCEDQSLGESVAVTGTPWRLHYQSQRTPGRRAAYTLQVSVTGPTVPAGVISVPVQVTVAGRLFQATFPPQPNLTYTVQWDGNDAYGRLLQGAQLARIRLGHTYQGQYAETNTFGYNGNGIPITGSQMRQEVTLWAAYERWIWPWDGRAAGLGGWSLSVHHAYDPGEKVLYFGDGTRRSAGSLGQITAGVAGNGVQEFAGDGGPATAASFSYPVGAAVAPDGSIFIADLGNNRVRRVGPDGFITTVAGNGLIDQDNGGAGDGGVATSATIGAPEAIALGPDGSLFISQIYGARIRRVTPDGLISTFAGNGGSCEGPAGDGGPATAAAICPSQGLAVGPDGSVYIPDYAHRVRRVAPDGIISTIAGTGSYGFSGDGGPATQARLWQPSGLALASDGSLLIADTLNHRIRRVGPDGIITTIAGSGIAGFSGDGSAAIAARLDSPRGVAVADDGSVFITSGGRVRRVSSDGRITTVAGGGSVGFPSHGDGGPATSATLGGANSLAMAPDGTIIIPSENIHRVRRLRAALPGVSVSDFTLASEDGRQIYTFSANGRHLRTLDALTGALRYQFGYDPGGYLTSITDGPGNVTTIERTGALPTAIVAPGGQRTTLAVNANGWLTSVTNPALEAHTMTYSPNGLLQTFTDPMTNGYSFAYDALGRLILDEDPAGGSTTLSRTEQSNGYTVSTTSALGRTRTYMVERLSTGAVRRTVTTESGAVYVTLINTDQSRVITYPDGVQVTSKLGPDPRFGMLAPRLVQRVRTVPGGLTETLTTQRTIVLANPNDLLSLQSLTDTVTVNARTFTRTYDAGTRTMTDTSAGGRQFTAVLDALGRVTQQQVGGLTPVSFTYDNRGLLGTITEGSGAASRTTSLVYDGARNLTGITDALGRTTSYTYDLAGRRVSQTLPDGRIIQYTFDATGNATAITPPSRPAHAVAYTAINRTSSYTPPDIGIGNTATQYSYNADRALTNISRPDGQAVDLTYDSAGRMSALTFTRGSLSYGYSAADTLTGVTAPGGIDLSYSYAGPLLTGVSWTGPVPGTIGSTYNNNLRVATESINGANSVSFTYDADGLISTAGSLTLTRNSQRGRVTASALGGVTDSSSYSAYDDLASYSASYAGTPIYDAAYTRDKLGRVTTRVETVSGVTTTFDYSYDLAGRIVEARTNGSTTALYTYDSNGNRLTYTGPGGTVNATYDNQDRLTGYGSTAVGYGANGEVQTKTAGGQTTGYQYDELGNLTSVAVTGGDSIEYLIDGWSRRVGKKVNGALVQGFLYQGQLRPVAETNNAGNVVSRFVYASSLNVPDYMIRGGVTYRIITDHLGSPRLVVDVSTGAVAQRMDFDEFGRVMNDSNPGFQPFGFAGGLYDPDTKLVRFGARDYDAEAGRWMTKDPIGFAGGDSNLYGYVGNDPVNSTDAWGLRCPGFWDGVWRRFVETNEFLPGLAAPGVGPIGLGLLTSGAVGDAIGTLSLGQAISFARASWGVGWLGVYGGEVAASVAVTAGVNFLAVGAVFEVAVGIGAIVGEGIDQVFEPWGPRCNCP